jgi:hypothetical protein
MGNVKRLATSSDSPVEVRIPISSGVRLLRLVAGDPAKGDLLATLTLNKDKRYAQPFRGLHDGFNLIPAAVSAPVQDDRSVICLGE